MCYMFEKGMMTALLLHTKSISTCTVEENLYLLETVKVIQANIGNKHLTEQYFVKKINPHHSLSSTVYSSFQS